MAEQQLLAGGLGRDDKLMLSCREAVLSAGAAAITQHPGSLSVQPSAWLAIMPIVAGFTPGLESQLDQAIADKHVWKLHRLVVLRLDLLLLERCFEVEDRMRGTGEIGHVTFTPNTMHDLRSCSKSVVGLLYGIALQRAKDGWSECGWRWARAANLCLSSRRRN